MKEVKAMSAFASEIPLVSVIMPAYNSERHIAEAIASVQYQTLGDWELCVTDDCSTDDTAEIITIMAEDDPRIRYAKQPANQGAAAARNEALGRARALQSGALSCAPWSAWSWRRRLPVRRLAVRDESSDQSCINFLAIVALKRFLLNCISRWPGLDIHAVVKHSRGRATSNYCHRHEDSSIIGRDIYQRARIGQRFLKCCPAEALARAVDNFDPCDIPRRVFVEDELTAASAYSLGSSSGCAFPVIGLVTHA